MVGVLERALLTPCRTVVIGFALVVEIKVTGETALRFWREYGSKRLDKIDKMFSTG